MGFVLCPVLSAVDAGVLAGKVWRMGIWTDQFLAPYEAQLPEAAKFAELAAGMIRYEVACAPWTLVAGSLVTILDTFGHRLGDPAGPVMADIDAHLAADQAHCDLAD